jgi:hypothetical protein
MTSSTSPDTQAQKAAAEPQERFPVIQSQTPGAMKLGKDGVYEFIPFP